MKTSGKIWKCLPGKDEICAQVYEQTDKKGFVVASVNRDADAKLICHAVNLYQPMKDTLLSVYNYVDLKEYPEIKDKLKDIVDFIKAEVI